MSDGYTPVFGSVFTGTLHGRWPDTGLWLCLLAMSNKHGEVDCTPQYIASATGLEVAEVTACIERFMQPDAYSRSRGEEGRRLIPLDSSRPWGWKIVNHSVYRERARKQARQATETASGRDAERKRKGRLSGDAQPCPANSGAVPLSDTDTDTDKNKRDASASVVLHETLPRDAWEEWLAHRREKRWSMGPRALKTQLKLLARYDTATQREMIDTSINAGWEGIFAPKTSRSKPAEKSEWM